MKIIIYLLESSAENAKIMVDELNHFAKMKNNDDTMYEFRHVPGASHQMQNLNGRKFIFYDDELFNAVKTLLMKLNIKMLGLDFLLIQCLRKRP